eukprot:1320288-Amorphochlora_amoeboformis.AAC.1
MYADCVHSYTGDNTRVHVHNANSTSIETRSQKATDLTGRSSSQPQWDNLIDPLQQKAGCETLAGQKYPSVQLNCDAGCGKCEGER